MKKIFFILFLLTIYSDSKAQETEKKNDVNGVVQDTINKKSSIFKKGHDPAKAALFSAIIPGSGQVYNKKYWKVPIVYAGLGGLAYWTAYNASELKGYTDAYKLFFDVDEFGNSDTLTIGSYNGYDTEKQIDIKRREFKKNLDISAIALGVWYILNIIDATVDAHLFNFNIDEDINLSLRPDIRLKNINSLDLSNNINAGISLQLNFK